MSARTLGLAMARRAAILAARGQGARGGRAGDPEALGDLGLRDEAVQIELDLRREAGDLGEDLLRVLGDLRVLPREGKDTGARGGTLEHHLVRELLLEALADEGR